VQLVRWMPDFQPSCDPDPRVTPAFRFSLRPEFPSAPPALDLTSPRPMIHDIYAKVLGSSFIAVFVVPGALFASNPVPASMIESPIREHDRDKVRLNIEFGRFFSTAAELFRRRKVNVPALHERPRPRPRPGADRQDGDDGNPIARRAVCSAASLRCRETSRVCGAPSCSFASLARRERISHIPAISYMRPEELGNQS